MQNEYVSFLPAFLPRSSLANVNVQDTFYAFLEELEAPPPRLHLPPLFARSSPTLAAAIAVHVGLFVVVLAVGLPPRAIWVVPVAELVLLAMAAWEWGNLHRNRLGQLVAAACRWRVGRRRRLRNGHRF